MPILISWIAYSYRRSKLSDAKLILHGFQPSHLTSSMMLSMNSSFSASGFVSSKRRIVSPSLPLTLHTHAHLPTRSNAPLKFKYMLFA